MTTTATHHGAWCDEPAQARCETCTKDARIEAAIAEARDEIANVRSLAYRETPYTFTTEESEMLAYAADTLDELLGRFT